MEDRRVLQIEGLQAAEWCRLPKMPSRRSLAGNNFLVQLPAEKLAEMGTEQAFKFFQIRVAAAGFGKHFLIFQSRKELLDRIQLAKERFPLWLRQDRDRRHRSIAVNPQLGKTGRAIQLIQHPAYLVFVYGFWLTPVRHDKG